MVDSTPDKKDLTLMEIASDVPEAAAIAMAAYSEFVGQTLPTTAVGWVEKIGFAPGGLVHSAAAAADQLKAGPVTIEEVMTILGVTPDSIIARIEALAAKVVAQAND